MPGIALLRKPLKQKQPIPLRYGLLICFLFIINDALFQQGAVRHAAVADALLRVAAVASLQHVAVAGVAAVPLVQRVAVPGVPALYVAPGGLRFAHGLALLQ